MSFMKIIYIFVPSINIKSSIMFSKTCEYGIRATIFIAEESRNGRKTGIKAIARQIDSPEAFTGKILQTLVKHKIIASSKGPSGGFYIPEESLSQMKLVEIVSAIDGDGVYTHCALGLNGCVRDEPCPLHNEFKHVRDEMESMLRSIFINDMTIDYQSSQTFLKR